MKQAKFETYKPQPDEFKIAKPRTGNAFKPYQPAPHPFLERLEKFREIKSLWTRGTVEGGE